MDVERVGKGEIRKARYHGRVRELGQRFQGNHAVIEATQIERVITLNDIRMGKLLSRAWKCECRGFGQLFRGKLRTSMSLLPLWRSRTRWIPGIDKAKGQV